MDLLPVMLALVALLGGLAVATALPLFGAFLDGAAPRRARRRRRRGRRVAGP